MKHLLCLGDSITDSGRIFQSPPLGCGYVQLLHEKFSELHNEISIRNCGVNGFTVSRLLSNAERDLYPIKDSVTTILIGINDIGLMMNTNRTETQKQNMMEEFFSHYEKLIRILSAGSAQIILMEPFLFPYPREYLLWIPYLETMSAGIARLSEKYKLPYLHLHHLLNKAAAAQGTDSITEDGIHLTARGHEILAEELFPLLNHLFLS